VIVTLNVPSFHDSFRRQKIEVSGTEAQEPIV